MMESLIKEFPAQLVRAMEIGKNAHIRQPEVSVRQILICGLGGSGIGANLAGDLLRAELEVPLVVNKDYEAPQFVDSHTLVILCSYSGNTEETLSALNATEDKAGKVVCITSNGKLQQRAKSMDYDCIIIPEGMPPRACLGYSFVQQLYVLYALGLIDNDFERQLTKSVDTLRENQKAIQSEARQLAIQIQDKLPIIYIDSHLESVAVRWRQQFNENSKMLCWHHVVPEMNHNELVGWRDKNEKLAVILLRTDYEHPRSAKRMEFVKEECARYTDHIFEVNARGDSLLEQALYLIHLGDWVSQFAGVSRGYDTMEIDVINRLKGIMAKA